MLATVILGREPSGRVKPRWCAISTATTSSHHAEIFSPRLLHPALGGARAPAPAPSQGERFPRRARSCPCPSASRPGQRDGLGGKSRGRLSGPRLGRDAIAWGSHDEFGEAARSRSQPVDVRGEQNCTSPLGAKTKSSHGLAGTRMLSTSTRMAARSLPHTYPYPRPSVTLDADLLRAGWRHPTAAADPTGKSPFRRRVGAARRVPWTWTKPWRPGRGASW